MPQSPDIGQNADGGISDFQIPGQSIIHKNCDKSKTSNNIDMKHGAVTKFDRKNTAMLKKIDSDFM